MQSPYVAFLDSLRNDDQIIQLNQFQRIPGGGTHDIYKLKSVDPPTFLLKVMKRSIDLSPSDRQAELDKLTQQYSKVYQIFGEHRCLIEHRSIEQLTVDDNGTEKAAIVSIVRFENCFQSEEKFGFNVDPLEQDEVIIKKNLETYKTMNQALMGNLETPVSFNLDDFLIFQKKFTPIFQKLDEDPELQNAMKEFLNKFKNFYNQTGILMDFIGLDNVLFYKDQNGWQFKLGSVIKHDTKDLTLRTLSAIAEDPANAVTSFEAETSTYFMPSCIRTVNAVALKLGMEKIVDDITLTDNDIDNLSQAHTQLKNGTRAAKYAMHHDFENALHFFDLCIAEANSRHDTYIRHTLGTHYWEFIKNSNLQPPKEELQKFLDMLTDPRNEYPPDIPNIDNIRNKATEAINGLRSKLANCENFDNTYEVQHAQLN